MPRTIPTVVASIDEILIDAGGTMRELLTPRWWLTCVKGTTHSSGNACGCCMAERFVPCGCTGGSPTAAGLAAHHARLTCKLIFHTR